MQLTNKYNLPLSMAVWLGTNEYDYIDEDNYISATELLKPIKQLILKDRIETPLKTDIIDLIPSRIGTAIHTGAEKAWINKIKSYKIVLKQLGYSQKIINRIKINPTVVTKYIIPIYLEQRSIKEIDNYKIGGKFDFVGDGILEDIKTTGCYSYMKSSNDTNYKLQGSIYKWLNPKIITSDFMRINYIFTDWSKLRAMIENKKGYPEQRIVSKKIKLYSIKETEKWIKNKLYLLNKFKEAPQNKIPECTIEDLWQDATVFKYYKNPAKTVRATRNFDNYISAQAFMEKQNGQGIIKEIPGQIRRCKYCNVFDICEQKNKYIENGLLQIEETDI